METRREGAPPVMRWAFRIAVLCGALPLLTGTGIFVAWLVTRADVLMDAGLYTIFWGIVTFAGGMVAFAVYFSAARRARHAPRDRARRASRIPAVLLFANFPLAGAIVVAATIVDSCYTVVVVNESTERIENARVVGAGYDELVGTVSPGGRRSVWIWPALQGRLELRARIGASERVELVDGYTLGGGKAVVTLRPDGELDVRLFDH